MPSITRPAVNIQQGKLQLFLTYVTPRDFEIPNFYGIEKLDPGGEGFQRILNATRAKRLARHLNEGFATGYANLPTTIFLATDKRIEFNANRNEITFETEDVCPFSVVDGQHRIAGLRDAVTKQDDLYDFKLPATIAVTLNNVHQMYHFYMVNTTQVSVEQSLQQQITKRFTDMSGVQELPYFPHWLQRRVSLGTDSLAISLLKELNENTESPLRGKIHMANDASSSKGKIKQAAFANVLTKNIFTVNNPAYLRESPEKLNQITLNYFRAIDSLYVPDGKRETSRVYQNNGIFFFITIAKHVFHTIYSGKQVFTPQAIKEVILQAMDELDPSDQMIAESSWWNPPPGTPSLNRDAATRLCNEFAQAIGRFASSHSST